MASHMPAARLPWYPGLARIPTRNLRHAFLFALARVYMRHKSQVPTMALRRDR